MNAQLLNPFARDTPERVGGTLENACANCLAFNGSKGLFAGNYLAVGRTDGLVSVWDLETRTVLRWYGAHVKTVTSVSWSPYNRYLVSSSLDWNVNIFDLATKHGRCVRTLRFDAPVTQAVFSPHTSRLLLVVFESRQGLLVAFPSAQDVSTKPRRIPLGQGTKVHEMISSACFTPDGRWVAAGTTKGGIALFDTQTGALAGDAVSVGASSIRQMGFDATGKHLVVNMNDRTIRTFRVVYRSPDDMEVDVLCSPLELTLRHKFQDLVGRTPWNGIAFSSDAEYVMGGASRDAAHNVYIWDRDSGVLVKILEGPREPLLFAQWHPLQPQIASIASSGDVHLWSTKATEIWSAYAPGFEELEKNVEYEEREDEFDLEDEAVRNRKKRDEETGFVNIFSTGPASDAMIVQSLAPPQLYRAHSNLEAWLGNGPCPTSRFVDDDDQVRFFIPPLLEENVA